MQDDEAEVPARAAQGEGAGRNPDWTHAGAESCAATAGRAKSEGHALIEQVVERGNMRRSYRRVVGNKGSAGVDHLTVTELDGWLRMHWPSVKQALLEGRYTPQPVRRVDIPKPDGGVRTLGVPTAVDRLIQQALHQVLQPVFEPSFSNHSHGFRPGRSALGAVAAAQSHIRTGKRWVVDMDLRPGQAPGTCPGSFRGLACSCMLSALHAFPSLAFHHNWAGSRPTHETRQPLKRVRPAGPGSP